VADPTQFVLSSEAFLFYALAAVTLLSALVAVGMTRNVVVAAFSLVLSSVGVAGIFVLLSAHLLGAFQIWVYASSVFVLLLFALSSLAVRGGRFGALAPLRSVAKWVGVVAAGWLYAAMSSGLTPALRASEQSPEGFGGVRDLGSRLFSSYLVPVELIALLLLVVAVGGVVAVREKQS